MTWQYNQKAALFWQPFYRCMGIYIVLILKSALHYTGRFHKPIIKKFSYLPHYFLKYLHDKYSLGK